MIEHAFSRKNVNPSLKARTPRFTRNTSCSPCTIIAGWTLEFCCGPARRAKCSET